MRNRDKEARRKVPVGVDYFAELTENISTLWQGECPKFASQDVSPNGSRSNRISPRRLEGMIDGRMDRAIIPCFESARQQWLSAFDEEVPVREVEQLLKR